MGFDPATVALIGTAVAGAGTVMQHDAAQKAQGIVPLDVELRV